jgi:hypothetical protein
MIINEEYINPDILWQTDDEAIAFIFQAGRPIMYGQPGATHEDIISRELNVGDEWDNEDEDAWRAVGDLREEWEQYYLYGRIGWMYDQHIVTIWQNDESLLDHNLGPCIQQLLSDKMVVKTTLITTPRGNTTIEQFLEDPRKTEANEVSDEDLELLKQLHLMPPEQKKTALMQMGATGGHKHPWQQATEQSKLISPGQKWWAATSEAYLRLCQSTA